MQWSTGSAEQVIRKVFAPLAGLGLLIGEQLRDGEDSALLIGAAVALILGQPVARILDSRREPDPPPPDPPAPQRSPTAQDPSP